ncbi:MAG: hypothetical protein ISS48_03175 [Candidatus Aenigmarchaeota archaeon]|nr:hypothetical protein [Candidatus Aenigmarchaeota archaeon]
MVSTGSRRKEAGDHIPLDFDLLKQHDLVPLPEELTFDQYRKLRPDMVCD